MPNLKFKVNDVLIPKDHPTSYFAVNRAMSGTYKVVSISKHKKTWNFYIVGSDEDIGYDLNYQTLLAVFQLSPNFIAQKEVEEWLSK